MMAEKSRFLHHEACGECGSSDAKAVYSDGGTHCFSCGYTVRSKVSGYVRQNEKKDDFIISLPDDLGFEFDEECVKWLEDYQLTPADMVKHNVRWSKRHRQLVFMYKHMEKPTIGCIQARNFTVGRTKYHNQGDVSVVLPIFKERETPRSKGDRVLILVEDAISAIKIVKTVKYDAMPLLGSYLSLNKIARLTRVSDKYDKIIVWLDHDKYKEALSIAEKFRYCGAKTYVVTSDLDPKCYAHDAIVNKLWNGIKHDTQAA